MSPSPDTPTPHDHDRARRVLALLRIDWERELLRLVETHPGLQPTPALIGSSAVAELIGIRRSNLSRWRRRHPDFPEPLYGDRPGGRPRWRRADVLDWLSGRGRGEGRS